ncbi:SDR family NAD(P)-dependent oxidoreductase [Coralloluteibacterium stylophorae]|uniref:SDR family oxidoreductase n=1 Tax=Coralloluteibacterium stylophorae TaxID=1776034 RepID=A0A8J8AW50_9GAMM|nr:SDR family oxidoreductase [Coralloluteibacterium stylophorae]MBS7455542.1 SDR family oxidoreductase [Coralloluteibacterium stylophorae]
MRFNDKVVIVTGAASGIGRATAERFSAEGARVVLADIDAGALEEVAKGLPAERTLARTTDVSKQEDVEALVGAAVERFGRLDVIHNNAGILVEGTIADTSAADWHRAMATNVDGMFFGAKAALPHLRRSRGCIVNTASVSGLGGDVGMAAYNANKGAIVNLTRAMAIDHGREGVRVNAVAPSLTRTGMTTDIVSDAKTVDAFTDRIPMNRYGEPEDVAKVVLFLASDDAGFVNGAIVPVDGGLSAANGQPLYETE